MSIRKIILVFLFCCLTIGVSGQEITSKVYDSLRIYSAFNQPQGYLTFGGKWDLNSSNGNGLIMGIDNYGDFNWAKAIDDSNYDLTLIKAIRLKSNAYMSLGFAFNPVNFTSYLFIIKTDTVGNLLLAKKITPSDSIGVYDFIENNDGSITFCGTINYGNIPVLNVDDRRFMIFQADSNLNFIWGREYIGKINAGFYSFSKTPNGNYILQGQYDDTTNYQNQPFNSRTDIAIANIDQAGNLIWAKRIGNTLFPVLPGYGETYCRTGKVLALENGDILNAFTSQWYATQFTNGKDDVILQRLDSFGNELYSQRFGDETYGSQSFNTLTIDNSDIVFDAGQFLIKCDSLFQLKWINSMQQANGYSFAYPLEEILKSNNDTGYTGFLPLFKSNTAHFCFFKTDSLGRANCINLPIPFFTQPEVVGSNDISSDLFSLPLTVLFDSSLQFTTNNYFASDTLICQLITGLNEHSYYNFDIDVFPTLVLNDLIIKIKELEDDFKYEIITTDGQVLIKNELLYKTQSVNISHLSQGMYIVRVFNRSKEFHKKIIRL